MNEKLETIATFVEFISNNEGDKRIRELLEEELAGENVYGMEIRTSVKLDDEDISNISELVTEYVEDIELLQADEPKRKTERELFHDLVTKYCPDNIEEALNLSAKYERQVKMVDDLVEEIARIANDKVDPETIEGLDNVYTMFRRSFIENLQSKIK